MRRGRHDIEHGEMVEKELDNFIERRGADARRSGKDQALEEMWRASERRERERRRRENGALWYEFHMRLSETHARLSTEHEESALALLEDERDGEERLTSGKKAAYGRSERGPQQGCQNGTKPRQQEEGGATT